MQRKASFALEEGVRCKPHTAKFRRLPPPSLSFGGPKGLFMSSKQRVEIKHSRVLPQDRWSRISCFEWLSLDELINVYHLFPQPSFPPPYLFTKILAKWISFNVKLLHLIKANVGLISESPSGEKHNSYKQYLPSVTTHTHTRADVVRMCPRL